MKTPSEQEQIAQGMMVTITLMTGSTITGAYHHTYAPKDGKSDAHLTLLINGHAQSYAFCAIQQIV